MSAIVKEVAKRAGLSSATVSRILNGKGGHSSETVKTVEKIVAEMGFSATNHSSTPDAIGIVALVYNEFLTQPYTSSLLSGIIEVLTGEGFIGQIIPVTPNRLSHGYVLDIIKKFGLKGLIIQEFAPVYELSKTLERIEIPKVFIGELKEKPEYYVMSNNYQAGWDAASYFWSLGHRRFGMISGYSKDYGHFRRIEGYKAFLKEHEISPESIWTKSYHDIELSVTNAVAELVNLKEKPTAIYSLESQLSLKFIQELGKTDIRIPDDISLISMEERGELDNISTPVTVLRQPTKMIGERAAATIINIINGRDGSEPYVYECSLLARKSTVKFNS